MEKSISKCRLTTRITCQDIACFSAHFRFFGTFVCFQRLSPFLKRSLFPEDFGHSSSLAGAGEHNPKMWEQFKMIFFSCFFLWMWAKIPFKIQNSLKTQNAVIHQPIYTHVYSISFYFTDCCLSSRHKEWSQNTARTFPVQTIREYESLVSSFS